MMFGQTWWMHCLGLLLLLTVSSYPNHIQGKKTETICPNGSLQFINIIHIYLSSTFTIWTANASQILSIEWNAATSVQCYLWKLMHKAIPPIFHFFSTKYPWLALSVLKCCSRFKGRNDCSFWGFKELEEVVYSTVLPPPSCLSPHPLSSVYEIKCIPMFPYHPMQQRSQVLCMINDSQLENKYSCRRLSVINWVSIIKGWYRPFMKKCASSSQCCPVL